MAERVIEINNLSKSFGNIRALEGVTFHVEKGEIFGYVGPNGAGKTTTIRHILGLLTPDEGSVKVLGSDSRNLPREIRRKIGVVLETDGLYPHMSAEENLNFYSDVYGVSPGKIKDVLKFVGLYERKDRVVKFSRGMKRRLALARALLPTTEILICDELTTGLDPHQQQVVRELVCKLAKEQGTTVFFSSHNLSEVQSICTTIGLINKGKILAFGKREEISKKTVPQPAFLCELVDITDIDILSDIEQLDFVKSLEKVGRKTVKITLTKDDYVSSLINFLSQKGVRLEEIKKDVADLEKIYFDIVKEDN